MSICPICDTEYDQKKIKICQTCGLNFSHASQLFSKLGSSDRQEFIFLVKGVWQQAQGENLELRAQLAETKRDLDSYYIKKLENLVGDLKEQVSEIDFLKDRVTKLETQAGTETPSSIPSQLLNNQFTDIVDAVGTETEWLVSSQFPPDESPDTITINDTLDSSGETESVVADEVSEFVKLYNTGCIRLEQIIPASETKESIEARRAGTQKFPRFKSDSERQGDYWIVSQEDTLYVVPKANLKINEHKVRAMEAAFDCNGYQASISDRFQLVKPAEVTETNGEWKLIDRGILQFSNKN